MTNTTYEMALNSNIDFTYPQEDQRGNMNVHQIRSLQELVDVEYTDCMPHASFSCDFVLLCAAF